MPGRRGLGPTERPTISRRLPPLQRILLPTIPGPPRSPLWSVTGLRADVVCACTPARRVPVGLDEPRAGTSCNHSGHYYPSLSPAALVLGFFSFIFSPPGSPVDYHHLPPLRCCVCVPLFILSLLAARHCHSFLSNCPTSLAAYVLFIFLRERLLPF